MEKLSAHDRNIYTLHTSSSMAQLAKSLSFFSSSSNPLRATSLNLCVIFLLVELELD